MNLKESALSYAALLLKGSLYLAGRDKGNLISATLAEKLVPIVSKTTPVGTLNFFCPAPLPEWRVRSLLVKEPETLEWIDRFSQDDVFWDIGANIGVYSLYAGFRNIRVKAFEPSAPNYYLLNRNIEINKLHDRVYAYCLAFSDRSGLDVLYMTNAELGGALNSFGELIDWQGGTLQATAKQGMLGYTIDDFIDQFHVEFPNHIKIDVDGIENRIIAGAAKTLSDARLKSLLVELDSSRQEYCDAVFKMIEAGGMKFLEKRRSAIFDNTPYASCFNYFFRR